ncbi:hypothetical protein [Aquiflexum sp.]|uniref:hypothetical protein n=1 Tax=Aquiflexum sp. TaxID=1872584 RepID=UPI003593ACEB
MIKVATHPTLEKPKWFGMEDPTKLSNSFEFGPAWWIHLPMYILGVLSAMRLRNIGFFEAVNPGMQNGGLFDSSKFEVLKFFNTANTPKTILTTCPLGIDDIISIVDQNQINFPLIAKPDFGERGREVEVIDDLNALHQYFSDKYAGNYLIQENIEKGIEFGVFFQRHPISGLPNISSLALKIPLQVIGDGKLSIGELIRLHPRVRRYTGEVDKKIDSSYIPQKGEKVKLSQKGNHCKGAAFLDCSGFIDESMVQTFDVICSHFEGFNYGRLDVKVGEWEDLWNVTRIKIIEVNGCNSEPIHIYSPDIAYSEALSSIKHHFTLMSHIAKTSLRNGYRPDIKKLWSNFLQFRKSRKSQKLHV